MDFCTAAGTSDQLDIVASTFLKIEFAEARVFAFGISLTLRAFLAGFSSDGEDSVTFLIVHFGRQFGSSIMMNILFTNQQIIEVLVLIITVVYLIAQVNLFA